MVNTSFMAPQRSGIGMNVGLAQGRARALPAAQPPVLQTRRAPAQLPLFQPPGAALR